SLVAVSRPKYVTGAGWDFFMEPVTASAWKSTSIRVCKKLFSKIARCLPSSRVSIIQAWPERVRKTWWWLRKLVAEFSRGFQSNWKFEGISRSGGLRDRRVSIADWEAAAP